MKKLSFILSTLLFLGSSQAQPPTVSFEKWISLKQVSSPVISPDGKWVVFTVQSTDWSVNSYDAELWLAHFPDWSHPVPLTRTEKGSSSGAQFSPDGKWIGFLADRGNKTQLYVISPSGGEAIPVTQVEEGIDSYRWSHNSKVIAFTKTNPESKKEKSSLERYGGFYTEDEGYRQNSLWSQFVDMDSLIQSTDLPCYGDKGDSNRTPRAIPCLVRPKPTELLHGDFYITNFEWAPGDKIIAYQFQPDNRVKSSAQSDIGLLDVSTKKSEIVIHHPSSDNFGQWSPDGLYFTYSSHLADTSSNFYTNNHLLIYDLTKKIHREILKGFDETISPVEWNAEGIYFAAMEKMKSSLYLYHPEKDKFNKVELPLDVVSWISFSKNGKSSVVSGRNFNDLNEIFVQNDQPGLQRISDMNRQIESWNTPKNEIIQWKSDDGTLIEGVLLKPRNFNMHQKYPLLVVIHGGPTGVDRPEPVPTYVYPILQWCEKGAIVLRINYRGSAGYGEKFRSLNVNNLGVGDMWDVLSGVRYLTSQGFVDTARMGCMGWSQGGYISAFLTTHTKIFKAISVGAGISDWMTYYVNTDITPFTRQYLQSTPWSNPAIYQKTSPITNILQASTPTLIQHGEFDRRVPVPNGYELYRGLLDNGVPAKLIIYKGFGHGITKPKERLAATWHNWVWFNHYVFGEPMESLPLE